MTDEVRITNPITGAQKGQKAARASLLPWTTLMEVAEHYGRGAEKYDLHNWRRGTTLSLNFDALCRHLADYWEGEDCDPETGSSHLSAVVFHALAMMTTQREHPELDDRPHVVLAGFVTAKETP